MFFLLLLVSVISSPPARALLLDGLDINCNDYHEKCEKDHPFYHLGHVCGSDGQTYTDYCELEKARCRDHKHVRFAHPGYCRYPHHQSTSPSQRPHHVTSPTRHQTIHTSDVTSAPTVPPTTPNHERVMDLLCVQLSFENCPQESDELCGSDKSTYVNYCEFQKARCMHRQLTVSHQGFCN